jgi:nucleotide-binding universal stress UspA family protein
LKALIPPVVVSRGIATQGAVVEHHKPGVAICQAANRFEADLICMGSRSRSRFKEAIFGSVSQAVMTQSERAVFVLRGNEKTQSAKAMKHQPINQGK